MSTPIGMSVKKTMACLMAVGGFILIAAPAVNAGTWGQENWGQMYWGDNPVSAPVAAPTVSVEVDGSDIIASVTGYTEGSGADGWSVITGYSISCSGGGSSQSESAVLSVADLEPDTEYTCSVVASNAQGSSPEAFFTQRTDLTSSGLPIWLLYEASQGAR